MDERSTVKLTFGTYLYPLFYQVTHNYLASIMIMALMVIEKSTFHDFPICMHLESHLTLSPMLHTKAQGYWLLVTEKTILNVVLHYMGVAVILVM